MVYKLKDLSKYYLFSVGLRLDGIITLVSEDLFDFDIGSAFLSYVSREGYVGSSLGDHSSLGVNIRDENLDWGVIFWSDNFGSGAALSGQVFLDNIFVLIHNWLHLSVLEFFAD